MKVLPNISIGFMGGVGIGSSFGPQSPQVLFFDVGYVAPDVQVCFFEVTE